MIVCVVNWLHIVFSKCVDITTAHGWCDSSMEFWRSLSISLTAFSLSSYFLIALLLITSMASSSLNICIQFLMQCISIATWAAFNFIQADDTTAFTIVRSCIKRWFVFIIVHSYYLCGQFFHRFSPIQAASGMIHYIAKKLYRPVIQCWLS